MESYTELTFYHSNEYMNPILLQYDFIPSKD